MVHSRNQIAAILVAVFLGFLCVACAIGEMRGQLVSASTALESARIPDAVRAFMASNFDVAQMDVAAIHKEYTTDFSAEYTLLYYSQTIDWRDKQSRAWLIGYRVARVGNGAVPVNRVVLVDDYGGVADRDGLLVRLPEKCAGDDGIALELRPGFWAFAVSCYEGRHTPCNVNVFTLTPQPKQLLKYGNSDVALAIPDTRRWYSTLYFLDVNDDGTKDVVVDRTVRDWLGKVKWKEYELYMWEDKAQHYGNAQSLTEERFTQLLNIGKRRGGVMQFEQRGPP